IGPAAPPLTRHAMQYYGRASYWDYRYTNDPEPFDWYQKYSALKEFLGLYIRKNDAVLVAGAGNSSLSEEMYQEGITNITNVDISRVVVDQMQERHRGVTSMVWQEMDMCALDFGDASFNVVLDKGTMDSILCGKGSITNVTSMCMEVSRVLKSEGIFIIVSYGIPSNRLQYLQEERYKWRVSVHSVPKPSVTVSSSSSSTTSDAADPTDAGSVHYIYICQKGPVTSTLTEKGTETGTDWYTQGSEGVQIAAREITTENQKGL
ncbi:protein kinase domain protein, partial [Nannochloropsis oceanica]